MFALSFTAGIHRGRVPDYSPHTHLPLPHPVTEGAGGPAAGVGCSRTVPGGEREVPGPVRGSFHNLAVGCRTGSWLGACCSAEGTAASDHGASVDTPLGPRGRGYPHTADCSWASGCTLVGL